MPRRIQVTSGFIQKQHNERKAQKPQHIELKLQPLVPSGAPFQLKKPTPVTRTEGYALNRTQSTGGIATKVSLELKKKYLLGEPQPGNIQKSGSASTLDTKFKSFHTNISDCQKLLKPAAEISASMQTFCNKLDERTSPVSPQSSFLRQLDAIQQKHNINPSDKANNQPDIKEIVGEEKVENKIVGENNLPDVTNVTQIAEGVAEEPYVFVNESEGRPRSPVHETSIIVPQIDWSKQKNSEQSEDSLSESEQSSEELPKSPNYENIPRVEVHVAKDDDKEDDFPLDSLIVQSDNNQSSLTSNPDPPKSISSEKKTLNQPKPLPDLKDILPQIHSEHMTLKEKKDSPETDNKSIKNSSGRSTPDSCAEQVTCALTETELSDWARDGAVSDDLEDDLEMNQDRPKFKENVHYIEKSPTVRIAKIVEFDELGHVCGKEKQAKEAKNKTIITEAMNSILSSNLDNIEFMDTGTETSSDEGVADSQNNGYTGYVLFKNEDDIPEDSLNPNINIVEAKNEAVNEKFKNTGYCVLANSHNNFGSEVIDLKPSDLNELKQKQMQTDHEEDSLLILEPGTTTEENTCSDSTVKNITEITTDHNKLSEERKRLEEKLAKVKAEFENQETSHAETNEFKEHCQRLQSKVEFGNARDSIDIRKSRRKSKSELPQKPDLIQEEKEKEPKDITLNLQPTVRTPDILYKKEIIQMERDENQKLIQEMVMNKMKAENKSLERKKRNRTISGISPGRPNELSKSATTNLVSKINLNNLDKSNRESLYSNRDSTYSTASSTYVLLPAKAAPLQTSKSLTVVPDINNSLNDVFSTPLSSIKERNSRPLSYHSFAERKLAEIKSKLPETPLTNPENYNLADIKGCENFITPKPPPRLKHDEITRTTEKLKSEARVRARLLSNEDLGLSPEEKMAKLREKYKRCKENEETENIESLVLNAERKNSFLYSNDTLSKKRNGSFKRSKSGESDGKLTAITPDAPPRTKSTQEISKNLNLKENNNPTDNRKICKSDPNLLETEVKPKKKSKDRERRRSITKMITGIFNKISPKAKENNLSKSCANLDLKDNETVLEEPIRQKCNSEVVLSNKLKDLPPPVPPLPLNYTRDESSDGDLDCRRDRSSCDTLDQSGLVDNSVSSATGKKAQKARKHVRQTQLKRHRMAQEIQRKLEETEVKTRELEERGVLVEKALRGETLPPSSSSSKDETDLLQEWFDLMRDRTELRRYEKELMVRAQELELEDRHSRLQQELRERLEIEGDKTEEDLRIEQNIVTEMMEIVTKRDRLIAVLEEERLRYSNEDRDLEEQMLAKGLRLTPIRKSTDK